ncbi:Adaptor complex protein [Plasmodium coatneyi]|uniref:Adaptor complex protein n=1 Tax=Plasmodium coatneyi TaxID=208452 RepID=A0A1B1E5N4_9APIC|nr:Adaptor complex protein [Plasmodium coatneyi]ANQ10270.1 Adaptor complex protein [Plasmodium coatneyi]
MDALYIYAETGQKLVEQIFANDINAEATHVVIRDIVLGSNSIERFKCAVVSSGNGERIIREAFEGRFIFITKKDDLYFVILKKDENNPVMTVEVIREIMELFKKYFRIEKLSADIITNNYSVVIFLINEIIAQGGKPNIFVDEILKNLVESNSGLLNETLKYTPVANNLCNLLALKKNVAGENVLNGANINPSYSNGTAIHCRDSQNVFWRANNVCHMHHQMCVEIRESVNCVLTKKNKIIHFAIQGNVIVDCSINGSPLIKMSFNRRIRLPLTHLHYTVNYNMLLRKMLSHQNAEKNAFYFVPLNERYIVMQYLYYFPLKQKGRGLQSRSVSSSVSTAPELTNVLNLTNGNSTQNVPSGGDNKAQEGTNPVGRKHDEVTTEGGGKKEDEVQNEKKELSPAEDRFKKYMEENNRPVPEESLHSSSSHVVRFAPTDETIPKVETQNGNAHPSNDNKETILIRDTLPSVENNEQYLLPIKVKGVVNYMPNEYKYTIKLQLLLNDIHRGSHSDMRINGYENISVRIPVYNFIKYVNVLCTVGSIAYSENCNSVIWFIDRVENADIDLSAELTLFIQPKPDGLFRSHKYYYEKFIRCNNDENINGLPDTSRGNGISNYCYHGESARNCKIMRRSDNSSNIRGEVRIFPNRLSKWYNIETCSYPDFVFPVYVSFTVTGITASGKRVVGVELKRPQNTCLHTVYRYSTTYNHVEFRI